MAAKLPILKPLTNRYDFKIYHIDQTGTPDMINHPDDAMVTCALSSINIALAAVKKGCVDYAWKIVAADFFQKYPNAWLLQGRPTEERATGAVRNYVGMYHTEHPFYFLDESMRTTRTEAFHGRRITKGEFHLSDQYITLNGRIARRMLAAAIAAHTSQDKNDETNQEYRCWQFAVANTILHEMCRIFQTL